MRASLEGPGRIVAAVAVVAAGLAPGEAIAGQIAAVGYDPAAVTAAGDAALADDALVALLAVVRYCTHATIDELAAALRSYQPRYDRELPLEF